MNSPKQRENLIRKSPEEKLASVGEGNTELQLTDAVRKSTAQSEREAFREIHESFQNLSKTDAEGARDGADLRNP